MTRVISGAMTKFGTVMPVMATAITAWSIRLFCRRAARIPTAPPMKSASRMAATPIRSDTGKPFAIRSTTV